MVRRRAESVGGVTVGVFEVGDPAGKGRVGNSGRFFVE
jgi:hypothetical protein